MRKAQSQSRRGKAPDRAGMERAVTAFLRAAGLDLRDPNLKDTAALVSEAWAEEFLDGYQKSPAQALGEIYPAPEDGGGLVVVTDLRFHGMCPHHLLPYEGIAHLAYLPKGGVVGFGRLAALVDCFAHRLLLQEELAAHVARSLAQLLDSPATACVVEARQACLQARGERQRDARTHAAAYEGLLRRQGSLRQELWARLQPRSRQGKRTPR